MTYGIGLILLALWVQLGIEKSGILIIAALLAQLVTIPVSGHMVALIAYKKNIPRYRHKAVDRHRARSASRKKA